MLTHSGIHAQQRHKATGLTSPDQQDCCQSIYPFWGYRPESCLLAANFPPSMSYPSPLIIPPTGGSHKQTFILLHGRGANADNFGPALLAHPIPQYANLQAAFPDAQFVFPTAARRRAVAFNRSLVTQWFDLSSIRKQEERECLQFEGLRESVAFVHELLRAAINEVGASNVVLWGLSQGCATSLISLLLWDGEPFAACIGMCGWLPLRVRLEEACADSNDGELDDPFARAENEPKSTSKLKDVAACLGDLLGLPVPSAEHGSKGVPVILDHGTDDETVPIELGRHAASFLESIGLNVTWREQPGLRHWYSSKMLEAILDSLATKTSMSPARARSEPDLPTPSIRRDRRSFVKKLLRR